jgi:transcriptional regulator with XRE-family HTH domain
MSQIERFNPSRLAFARKRRGFTKSKVASLIDVDLRSVSAYENGEFKPDDDRLGRLAKALKFPIEFFSGDDIEELSPNSASFRAMSKMTAGQRDMALGAGALALLVNKWIEDRFKLPLPSLPDLHLEESPEIAADSLRRHWVIS